MRSVFVGMSGIVVVAGLAFCVVGTCFPRDPVYGQHPPEPKPYVLNPSANSVIALDAPSPGGGRQIAVIDTQQRSMAVYHVDSEGAISLRSVRNIRWDLLMEEFNGGSPPAPREIRALIENTSHR